MENAAFWKVLKLIVLIAFTTTKITINVYLVKNIVLRLLLAYTLHFIKKCICSFMQ